MFTGKCRFLLVYMAGFTVATPSQAAFRLTRPCLVVRGLAAKPPVKKPDSAAKRARQAEKKRMYNKSRKSEMATRMKKVSAAAVRTRSSSVQCRKSRGSTNF